MSKLTDAGDPSILLKAMRGEGQDLRVCVSNKLPGDADAAGLSTSSILKILKRKYKYQKNLHLIFLILIIRIQHIFALTKKECVSAKVKYA